MNLSNLQLVRDESGRRRARWNENSAAGATLSGFLESDVQDPAYAGRLIQLARKALRTRGGGRSRISGNTYGVSIGSRTTLIYPQFGDSAAEATATLPTRELVSLLCRWEALA